VPDAPLDKDGIAFGGGALLLLLLLIVVVEADVRLEFELDDGNFFSLLFK
jgi:hypothetical protein